MSKDKLNPIKYLISINSPALIFGAPFLGSVILTDMGGQAPLGFKILSTKSAQKGFPADTPFHVLCQLNEA
jgi:hypothetical protein